jgi:hypothetical protein
MKTTCVSSDNFSLFFFPSLLATEKAQNNFFLEFLIYLFGEISPVKKHAKSMYLHEHKSGVVVVYRSLSQAHSIPLNCDWRRSSSRAGGRERQPRGTCTGKKK